MAMISPGPDLVGVDAVERLGDVQLGDAHVLDRAVDPAPRDRSGPCAACPWRTRHSASRPT